MSARLLVVEDEPMIGRILEHKLSREGHEVLWARSAAAAERVLVDPGGVDLALVDVTLERDGVEWAAGLAAAGRAPRLGWLAMVEQRALGQPERARQAGAAGVVVKPFKPTAVAAQVAARLEAAPA